MPDIRSEDREVQQYRTPPYSKEAEDGVLGALLIDNNTFDLIGGKIDSEDFYDYGNRLIFENIKRLLSQGKPADIRAVSKKRPAASNILTASRITVRVRLTFCATRKLFVIARFAAA